MYEAEARAKADLPLSILSSPGDGRLTTDSRLLALAESVAQLENYFLSNYRRFCSAILDNEETPEKKRIAAEQDMDLINKLMPSYSDFLPRKEIYAASYMKNEEFLFIWTHALAMIESSPREFYDRSQEGDASGPNFRGINNKADQIWRHFLTLASLGLLDARTISVFGKKWEVISAVSDIFHQEAKTPRSLPTW